ncbi:probable WRKY transcription factor 29 [Brachypodium distachyon]|uniref:WRKY domain-containing protein n=1 Tax=Brachypodium distachyon TaxID=15368 RepID=A0A0Q3J2J6_BRADI|nr:probable WRKY transcription factor 29 [Brachypodium distachyon]KQJ92544.1 hypothetical protein BRADI_4g44342v3 [Brachypodium distachyon]|eukprot:XP_010238804.1 probable WRKY transcription factor 29 [Brachypodium distachyon]
MMPAPEKEMLQRRERELLAQLHELLYSPSSSSSPAPSAGEPSWTSSSSGIFNNMAADLQLTDECSPVKKPAAPCVAGRRRGSKRRDLEVEEQVLQEEHGGCGGGARAKRRKKKKEAGGATRTLVTTVPDFDGYQWRKYGQKHIEAARYPRSYYRCTNSTDQGCPAKRTVQRNEDGADGSDGGTKAAPKYTVVYISAHTCKTTDSALVPPVILETTVPDVVPASSSSCSGSTSCITGTTTTNSPVSSSDATTWSERRGCSSKFAVDDDNLDYSCWDASTVAVRPSAAALLAQEMVDDFAGPIRSPVHAVAGGDWTNDFFVGEPPCVLNSCQLFGF